MWRPRAQLVIIIIIIINVDDDAPGCIVRQSKSLVVVLGVFEPLNCLSLFTRVAELCCHRQTSSTVLYRDQYVVEQCLRQTHHDRKSFQISNRTYFLKVKEQPWLSDGLAQVMSADIQVSASVIFVTKIKTTTRIIGRHFQRTSTRIIVIQKTKTKQKLKV